MKKNILITGSTDGIGLETAKMLAAQGHKLLLHGRNAAKLEQAKEMLSDFSDGEKVEGFVADLSQIEDVVALINTLSKETIQLDVLINNAGVYNTPKPVTQDGFDVRFVVNTIAPYLLTKRLLPILGSSSRVINLSSAAQSPVDLQALSGQGQLSANAAYAQSKLALTMWSRHLALSLKGSGPIIVAVNPGSLLGSKMVKDAFGVEGGDLRIGADILTRAALSEEFADASGKYFDNDSGQFTSPHPDALNVQKCEEVVRIIETVLDEIT